MSAFLFCESVLKYIDIIVHIEAVADGEVALAVTDHSETLVEPDGGIAPVDVEFYPEAFGIPFIQKILYESEHLSAEAVMLEIREDV